MTTVVNMRMSPYDVYIGRPKSGESWGFGNPFEVQQFGRGNCIGLYKDWLLTGESHGVVAATEERRQWILKNLHVLVGKKLGCFCKPSPCHGDVLVELLGKDVSMAESQPITSFRGRHSFLSNFHSLRTAYFIPVLVGNEVWYAPTSEHAFMACKTLDPYARKQILSATTPGEAKRLGRNLTLRADWEEIKLKVMKAALEKKFKDPQLAHALRATHPSLLVEGNTWHDNYWGSCACPLHNNTGENNLGKLLMEVRNELL